jgi:uncharacterized peroxidase-related enzyme
MTPGADSATYLAYTCQNIHFNLKFHNMSIPLVTPTQEQDAELRELIEFFNETLGFCPNSVLTMYHRPHLAKAFIQLNQAVMQNHGRVSSSLKRMIGYLASLTAGCRYCQAHTIRAAERYGAEAEQMENIWEFESHPAFSSAERAALRFAIAAASVPNGVDNVIMEEIRKHWDDGEIVEILGVVSLFGFLNRWNDSMGTQMEDGAVESGVKWLQKQGWNPGKHRFEK